ncbi:hypothetical protein A2U01_0110316, partial [Trifolium medium]|nr:hypothetical protein [Trifolium medium]
ALAAVAGIGGLLFGYDTGQSVVLSFNAISIMLLTSYSS